MPTLLRVHGFRFFFFSNEGSEPPHVHVERGDGHAKLWLDSLRLAYSVGMGSKEVRLARELAFQHRAEFLRAWNDYFGT